jgi:hypothetical protein
MTAHARHARHSQSFASADHAGLVPTISTGNGPLYVSSSSVCRSLCVANPPSPSSTCGRHRHRTTQAQLIVVCVCACVRVRCHAGARETSTFHLKLSDPMTCLIQSPMFLYDLRFVRSWTKMSPARGPKVVDQTVKRGMVRAREPGGPGPAVVPLMLKWLKTTPRLSAYFFEPPRSQNSM